MNHCSPSAILAALSTFVINIVTVIGPTPPGTGVIALAFSLTESDLLCDLIAFDQFRRHLSPLASWILFLIL